MKLPLPTWPQQVEFHYVPGERRLYYTHDKNGKPIPTEDVVAAFAFKDNEAWHRYSTVKKGVDVATSFLTIDHGFVGPPVLWETMVFGGVLDQEQDRYSSLAAAQQGHEDMVARVKKAEGI